VHGAERCLARGVLEGQPKRLVGARRSAEEARRRSG
jgi:hypothetical protein